MMDFGHYVVRVKCNYKRLLFECTHGADSVFRCITLIYVQKKITNGLNQA